MVISAKSPVICGIVTEMQKNSVISGLFSGTKTGKKKSESAKSCVIDGIFSEH